MMRFALVLILSSLFPMEAAAQAQERGKIPRVVWLTLGPTSQVTNRVEIFRQAMRELGHVEGKTVLIESRGADNVRQRTKAIADELVRLGVDVIVSAGGGVTRVVKAATTTIPIVMASDDDPVGDGFVASLARPGGNITGLSQLSPELNGKRLDLLKEVLPKLANVAVFGSVEQRSEIKEIGRAAAAVGVKVHFINVPTINDIEAAFRAAAKVHADGAIENIPGQIRSPRSKELAELAIKYRLPVMRERPEHVVAGGLMSYGVNLRALVPRVAVFVDKILKGAKPADIPVEQPTKFEFVVNLKAAKAIGLTIPPNVLARADRVIR